MAVNAEPVENKKTPGGEARGRKLGDWLVMGLDRVVLPGLAGNRNNRGNQGGGVHLSCLYNAGAGGSLCREKIKYPIIRDELDRFVRLT